MINVFRKSKLFYWLLPAVIVPPTLLIVPLTLVYFRTDDNNILHNTVIPVALILSVGWILFALLSLHKLTKSIGNIYKKILQIGEGNFTSNGKSLSQVAE